MNKYRCIAKTSAKGQLLKQRTKEDELVSELTQKITITMTMKIVRIHDKLSYYISKSSIKSGPAGSIIVSVNIAIIPKLVKIASIIHGERKDEYTDLPFHNPACLSFLNIIITINLSIPH